MEASEEIKREAAIRKARTLRYKKPLVKDINLQGIKESLAEMNESCSDVAWFMDSGDGADLEDILGDDDAYEFRMSFTELSADIDRLQEDLEDYWIPDYFDDFLAACNPDGTEMLGYDSYENDYFGLGKYETEAATREAAERMARKTKKELIDCAHTVIGVIVQYMAIKYRFDSLSSAYDVLLDRSENQLKAVRLIAEWYDKAEADKFDTWKESTRRFDRLIADLPPLTWVE